MYDMIFVNKLSRFMCANRDYECSRWLIWPIIAKVHWMWIWASAESINQMIKWEHTWMKRNTDIDTKQLTIGTSARWFTKRHAVYIYIYILVSVLFQNGERYIFRINLFNLPDHGSWHWAGSCQSFQVNTMVSWRKWPVGICRGHLPRRSLEHGWTHKSQCWAVGVANWLFGNPLGMTLGELSRPNPVHLESWLIDIGKSSPCMAEVFRFANYCNLPRYMENMGLYGLYYVYICLYTIYVYYV